MVLPGPEDVTPAWLTERLRAGGFLPSGRVMAVHVGQQRTTLLSTIVPLRVDCSPDAPAGAPDPQRHPRRALARPAVARAA